MQELHGPPPASRCAFVAGEPVTVIDGKQRRHLGFLLPGHAVELANGRLLADAVIGALPGVRLRTSSGHVVAVYRTTLEEYVLLMPRAATVVPPKDIAFLVHWADVFPGSTVVEAGVGSGALTLGLMRAVGFGGRIIGFELRPDHANRARKNIDGWPDTRGIPLDVKVGDVHQELAALRDVDRVILDLPDPENTLTAAAAALKPGGLLAVYVPGIRQIDDFVLAAMDHPEFAEPEVVEVMARPWVADRQRLRPELRIVGHTGFLARIRRRGPGLPVETAAEDAAPVDPAAAAAAGPASGTPRDPGAGPSCAPGADEGGDPVAG